MSESHPICLYCRHKTEGELICSAFLDRIPQDIIDGKAFHLVPRSGDGGTVFEVDPELGDAFRQSVAASLIPISALRAVSEEE